MSDDFSLADAEATFGPTAWAHILREAETAPEFSPEQREKFRALFASVRTTRPANPAADAA
jgi:hypothetical protein